MLLVLLPIIASVFPTAHANGGYLRWTFLGTNAYYPFDTTYPPALLRGSIAGADRIAILNQGNGTWQVTAVDIITGKPVWNSVFNGVSSQDSVQGVCTGDLAGHSENSLNLAFVQMGSSLTALDGLTGRALWQLNIPDGTTVASLSGWNNTVALLLHGQAIQSSYFPLPVMTTTLLGIDTSRGATKWVLNGSIVLPQTQADVANYYVEYMVTGEEVTLFSRGGRLAAISNDNGTVMWRTQVTLDGGLSTGQAANITHMSYIPRVLESSEGINASPPRILLNANNWGFQRFVLLKMNDTNTSSPASPLWRTKIPVTALDDIYFTQPVVDSSPSGNMFYYWSNVSDWTNPNNPTFQVYLVGVSLSTGNQIWQIQADYMGLPAAYQGQVLVVTTQGMQSIDGTSGSTTWSINQAPPSQYSYSVAPTFGNTTGLLVASRCLGPGAPSLCMYSAFAPSSSSLRVLPGMIASVCAFLMGSLLAVCL